MEHMSHKNIFSFPWDNLSLINYYSNRTEVKDYVHTVSFSLAFYIVLRPQGIRKQMKTLRKRHRVHIAKVFKAGTCVRAFIFRWWSRALHVCSTLFVWVLIPWVWRWLIFFWQAVASLKANVLYLRSLVKYDAEERSNVQLGVGSFVDEYVKGCRNTTTRCEFGVVSFVGFLNLTEVSLRWIYLRALA